MEKIGKEFNERIGQVLKERYDYNKSKMAKECGVSFAVIDNIVGERGGTPGLDTFASICRVTKISADWLLFGRGEMDWSELIEEDKNKQAEEIIEDEENKLLKIIKEQSETIGVLKYRLAKYEKV